MTGDILRELRKKRRLWKRAKYGQNKDEYLAVEKKSEESDQKCKEKPGEKAGK